jgi:branched-chain amino acid aminotransferase
MSEHEPDYSQGAAWIEGGYVPIAQARLPVLDWGFTRSDVTYDVVHVWKGSFFRLEDHLDRFQRSCSALRLVPPLDREAMRAIVHGCVRLTGLREAYVEMACTRGQPQPGSRDPRSCRNTFLAFAIPFVWLLPPERHDSGLHLVITSIPRIAPASVDPTVKNFHWGDMTRALFQAYDRGGDTAVLLDATGGISEGPGFNVFVVAQGKVRTPQGTVLEGITRRTVGELCAEQGIAYEAGTVTPEELRGADEVFLSSTAGGILPVASVDGAVLRSGVPGPITARLRDRYWRRHEDGWHATPVDYGAAEPRHGA